MSSIKRAYRHEPTRFNRAAMRWRKAKRQGFMAKRTARHVRCRAGAPLSAAGVRRIPRSLNERTEIARKRSSPGCRRNHPHHQGPPRRRALDPADIFAATAGRGPSACCWPVVSNVPPPVMPRGHFQRARSGRGSTSGRARRIEGNATFPCSETDH